MHIIQVGPYPLDANCIRGGVESSVYGLANALAATHQVDVFDVPRIGGKDAVESQQLLTIHRYANHGKYNIEATQRLDDILRDITALHPDVIHIHGTGDISAVIYKALQLQGFNVLLTVHGLLHVEKMNQLRKKFSLKHIYQYFHQSKTEFDLLSKTNHIIVDTEYVAKQIERLYKQRKIKYLPTMHVIPQGINSAYFSIQSTPNENHILSVGAISERKGHLYLLKAFEQVAALMPSAKLTIAGSLADTNYYQQLQAFIANSPYKDAISLATNLPQEAIFDLYRSAILFALHSQEESQGIVFAEAMATGLPVVATNVGGVPYVVEHDRCGLLCNYSDSQTMAEMICRILSNKEQYDAFSTQALQAAKKYDWQEIAKQIETIYTKKI
jgi:glycosyltransferase involved in cell wall biosynthesis